MATMSTQPGSKVPIPKVPTAIEPDPPAIPEDLGNLFLSPTARYEPSSTGWYVRWNGCGAYIGTPDGRKQSALRGMAIIEKLLTAKGEGLTTVQVRGSDEPLGVFGKSTWSRVCQEFGLDGDTSPSEANGFQVASVVPREDYETRDLLRRFDLALELIRAKLPLLADHLTQRILTPLKSDRAWRYADDDTHWTCGPIWQFDGSNFFVCDQDGRTWQIRFGQHGCVVGGSDGMWLLSAMLLHPGKELSADQICNEADVGPRWDNPDPGNIKLPRRHLADFRELITEFAVDLESVTATHYLRDNGLDEITDFRLPKSVSGLIDDLKLVVPKLKASAIESHAARALKAKGIVRTRSEGSDAGDEDFATLAGKLRRCEMLIADLQEWRRQEESRMPATEQDMADVAFRKRGWVNRLVTAAIDEISRKNAFLGSYFRTAFRIKNGRFVLNVGSKWSVVP